MAAAVLTRIVLTFALLAAAVAPARAGVVAVPGGYQVSYDMNLAGTLNGNPVTSIYILESDGTNFSIANGFTAAASGLTTLSHTIAFLPTSALVIGLDIGVPGVSDGKTHLVMLLDPDFFAANSTKLFSDAFPAVGGNPRVSHSDLIKAIQGADAGDATARDVVANFFLNGAGAFAAFDPAGPHIAVEYSGPFVIQAPEPASLALLGAGLLGLGVARRRRNVSDRAA